MYYMSSLFRCSNTRVQCILECKIAKISVDLDPKSIKYVDFDPKRPKKTQNFAMKEPVRYTRLKGFVTRNHMNLLPGITV
jgi:hypothetical protein